MKLYTLYSANSRRGSAAGRSLLWIPTRPSTWLPLQKAALVPAGSSICQQSVGCTAHSPPPSSPSLEATWCLHLPLFRMSERPALVRRLHISFSPFLWFRRAYGETFRIRATRADVYPELLQETREPGDHVQDGAPHLGYRFVFVFHTIVELQDMALHVRVTACMLDKPVQRAQDCSVRSGPGSLALAAKNVKMVLSQRLFAHVSVIASAQGTQRGPASGVAPSRSAVAILHWAFRNTCAWPSTSCQCLVHQH